MTGTRDTCSPADPTLLARPSAAQALKLKYFQSRYSAGLLLHSYSQISKPGVVGPPKGLFVDDYRTGAVSLPAHNTVIPDSEGRRFCPAGPGK